MNTTRTNRPTLDTLHHMPVNEVIALPADHLAMVQADAREALDAAKRMQDWIEAAIRLRYEQRAIAARGMTGNDTGTVRFEDGPVSVVADLPKKVEWDQDRLAAVVERIRAAGDDPAEYVEVTYKVAERAYTAWPEHIRIAFTSARTVRTGKPTFKLSLNATQGGV
jgi:hypothetical protein